MRRPGGQRGGPTASSTDRSRLRSIRRVLRRRHGRFRGTFNGLGSVTTRGIDLSSAEVTPLLASLIFQLTTLLLVPLSLALDERRPCFAGQWYLPARRWENSDS
jgi:hypothetical protein